ncbi:MAG: hypothetical protein SGARI_000119, partial [Bacillariaceae sp.]
MNPIVHPLLDPLKTGRGHEDAADGSVNRAGVFDDKRLRNDDLDTEFGQMSAGFLTGLVWSGSAGQSCAAVAKFAAMVLEDARTELSYEGVRFSKKTMDDFIRVSSGKTGQPPSKLQWGKVVGALWTVYRNYMRRVLTYHGEDKHWLSARQQAFCILQEHLPKDALPPLTEDYTAILLGRGGKESAKESIYRKIREKMMSYFHMVVHYQRNNPDEVSLPESWIEATTAKDLRRFSSEHNPNSVAPGS